MSPSPSIRAMTKQDKPPVMEILANTPEFTPQEIVVAEEVCDSYLQDPIGSGYHAFVSEIGTSVVGYVCFGPTPLTQGTWDIYWIVVAPGHQGRGIGGALLDFAESRIRETGRMSLIETSSKVDYERQRRFYLSHGYELVCRVPDFYTPGDDKLILWKRFS
ncbi:MAG: GNAT family N-acetyltransferase [Chloroflexi bacterium]|nr:GNAT family N-acetyltransferase [Chloroflexota bacterium]